MRPLTDVDVAPLRAPITLTELLAFRRRWLEESSCGGPHARRRNRHRAFAWSGVGVLVLLVLGVAARLALDPRAAASVGGADRARTIAATIAIGVPALGIVAGIAVAVAAGRVWAHRFRLDAFARANGFGLVTASGTPAYPGALFLGTPGGAAYDRLHALTGRALELGGYRYTMRLAPASSRSAFRFDAASTRRDWGYLALRLNRMLPQIVLEARAHRGALSTTGHPATYRGTRTLRLPGDHDRVFTLYCPAGAEPAAQRMFRPELLALLTDPLRTLDVELVDDWVFVYSPSPWDLTDPALVERLFRIAQTALDGALPDAPAEAGSGTSAADWPAERPDDTLPAPSRLGTIVGTAGLVVAAVLAVWLVASLALSGAG